MPEATDRCPLCGGSGWRIEERLGIEVAVRCTCRSRWNAEALLRASRIPPRYQHCTVENFETWDPGNPTLGQAKRWTREFIDVFPRVERGLLYMGEIGTGKTHLAVAALKELVVSKGVHGLYVNFLELVQQLQMSFDGEGPSREAILNPVTEADLVVLDELGAGRLTEWVRDLLYYVINSRYMAKRLTICTTNYLDTPQPSRRGAVGRGPSAGPYRADSEDVGGTDRWQETLTDRISDRLRSRLFEMCDVIDLRGEDYRSRRLSHPGARR